MAERFVIFRNISGVWCVTPEANYRRRTNIWYVQKMRWAKKPQDIVTYYVKNLGYSANQFTKAPDPLRCRKS